MPKRGEKGFTLVELLIVIAILAVLAAVVIPSVAGIFGKGAEQAYEIDNKTIRSAVFSFYSDVHDKDAEEWDGDTTDDPSLAHWYPTKERSGGDFVLSDTEKDKGNPRIDAGTTSGTVATDAQIADSAIWMGLLVNEAGTGEAGAPGTASVAEDESSLYLNEFPKSSSHELNGNPATPAGTYTWIVDGKGKVYGAYKKAWDEWEQEDLLVERGRQVLAIEKELLTTLNSITEKKLSEAISPEELAAWNRALEGLGLPGMEVRRGVILGLAFDRLRKTR